MAADVDGFLSKPPTELRDIRHGNVVQCPEHVFVKRRGPFFEADLDAIGQKLVLPVQVLLLNPVVKFMILLL
jgi:hypothetical protein